MGPGPDGRATVFRSQRLSLKDVVCDEVRVTGSRDLTAEAATRQIGRSACRRQPIRMLEKRRRHYCSRYDACMQRKYYTTGSSTSGRGVHQSTTCSNETIVHNQVKAPISLCLARRTHWIKTTGPLQ